MVAVRKKVKKKIAFLIFVAISKREGCTKIMWQTYFCEYMVLTAGLKGQKTEVI